ncbi:MAG: hypothetical protein ACK5II_04680 [Paracoccus sp. (in: a-proteobacteria)]
MSWGELVLDPVLAPLIGTGAAAFLVIVVMFLAVLVLVLSLWRGLRGAWWRTATVFLIAAAMSGPGLQRGTARALTDIVLLIDDSSASQNLSGRRDVSDAAMARIEEQLAAWSEAEIRHVTVGDSEDGTLLGSALSRAIAAEPVNRLAGAIIVSDGLAHDGTAIPADAPAPVHVLQSGAPADWDRRIVIDEAPRFALIDKPATIRLHITEEGAVPDAVVGRTITLTAVLDGEDIATVAISPGQGIDLPVTLETVGSNVIQLRFDALPGELTALNNQAALTINAVRDRLRVLLVSGEPNPGGRMWRNLLKSDANVDLIHFTILRPPEKFDGVPVDELALIAFPTRELFMDRLEDFDLIIFDRYRMRGILLPQYYDNIRRYVENGGAILVSAGPEFAGVDSIARSALGPVLPAQPTGRVIETPFTPQLTDEGRRHPVTEDLPGAPQTKDGDNADNVWGRWLRMIETSPAPDSTVAMTGPDNQPLLILRRQDEGRVALIASDQVWLWGRGFEGGGPQLDLMRRVAHWSMKEPELEEESLELGNPRGQVIEITRRSLQDIENHATVTGPDGRSSETALTETAPGRFSGQYTALVPGLYTVRQGGLARTIAIGPVAPREFEQTVADASAFAGVVAATRGAIVKLSEGIPDLRRIEPGRPASGAGLGGTWIGLTTRGAETVTGLSRTPLLPAWLWLVLIAGTMLTGWLAEGRRGS